MDGFYLTESKEMSKKLFLFNTLNNDIYFTVENEKKKKIGKKIAILAFEDLSDPDLLEKYKDYSLDLKCRSTDDQLKKVVLFFAKDPLPTIRPTITQHGLAPDYRTKLEYIIGPHVTLSRPFKTEIEKNDRNLIQLCVRCVGTDKMSTDFFNILQSDFDVISVDDKEIEETSKSKNFL